MTQGEPSDAVQTEQTTGHLYVSGGRAAARPGEECRWISPRRSKLYRIAVGYICRHEFINYVHRNFPSITESFIPTIFDSLHLHDPEPMAAPAQPPVAQVQTQPAVDGATPSDQVQPPSGVANLLARELPTPSPQGEVWHCPYCHTMTNNVSLGDYCRSCDIHNQLAQGPPPAGRSPADELRMHEGKQNTTRPEEPPSEHFGFLYNTATVPPTTTPRSTPRHVNATTRPTDEATQQLNHNPTIEPATGLQPRDLPQNNPNTSTTLADDRSNSHTKELQRSTGAGTTHQHATGLQPRGTTQEQHDIPSNTTATTGEATEDDAGEPNATIDDATTTEQTQQPSSNNVSDHAADNATILPADKDTQLLDHLSLIHI